jgi:hypothetical protein
MSAAPRWALEPVTNPSVLRLHVSTSITDRTIVTCPPKEAPAPLDELLAIPEIRSLDLHRYRVRLNLGPDGIAGQATGPATAVLRDAWGEPDTLPDDEAPRAFQVSRSGDRRVAESLEMAQEHGDVLLIALFEVEGVAEAIAGRDLVLVRLGRLFGWDDRGEAVAAALNG